MVSGSFPRFPTEVCRSTPVPGTDPKQDCHPGSARTQYLLHRTHEEAEANLLKLEEKWGGKYLAAIWSWQNNWEELATFFDYPKEIRRLIYTTNIVEGYHRQLLKVLKNKSSFPMDQSAR